MTGKALVKRLKREGWAVDRVHGSHHVMKKDSLTTIIPCHNTDLKPGILNAILKQTGLK